MPASRIAFAIADLTTEILALMPQDAQVKAELRLDPNTYARVVGELEHHFGQPVPREPIVQQGGSGESVKVQGMRIWTMLSDPAAGVQPQPKARKPRKPKREKRAKRRAA